MGLPRREDPLQHMLAYCARQKDAHAETLALGKWEGESKARELVGRVLALIDIENEMKKLLSPGSSHSHYAEQDLT